MSSDSSTFDRFIARLPKPEVHLHFEGALPWEVAHAADPQRYPSPPTSWAEDFRFRDFAHFEEELLGMAFPWFISPERYGEAGRTLFANLYERENVRYVETSFASGVMEFLGLNGQAVARAIRASAPEGLHVRVFMGIHHNGYHAGTRDFLEESLTWPELDGIDLHGTETFPLEDWTADFWARARAAGKETKAHAGEFDGPDFVRRVIHELGVSRIQHGVRASEDPALLEEMARNGVACDVCPISNVKLGVVPSIAAHPIRQMMEAGVACTINTDDPISFGNRLADEYRALHVEQGWTLRELASLAKNGFSRALLPEVERKRLLAEVDAVVKEFTCE